MSGFDCKFTEEPPRYLQSHCPICLLILREPFQVTCCGKSFCKACIQRIETGNNPCPTCNQDNFDSFQNKGLQQPLYGFQVFCSNKASVCDWQGELGELDQHLNLNPDKDEQSMGCAYTNVECLFCEELYQRGKIEHHQCSQCTKRPFTCLICKEYTSTYDDVITTHAPVCMCRPVECPNSCGANNLQHQHLEEHVSTQCPLSYVDCEFSDAGCDAKVHRKDLHSHLEENMVTHMSLLARENRKLKQQLNEHKKYNREMIQAQAEDNIKQFQMMDQKVMKQAEYLESTLHVSHVVPVDLVCSDVTMSWTSDPFYSHVGGYKLQLCMVRSISVFLSIDYYFSFQYLESEFPVSLPCTLQTTVLIIDHKGSEPYRLEPKHTVTKANSRAHIVILSKELLQKHTQNNQVIFRVVEVKILTN